MLHYREYGDAGFDPVDSAAAPRWARRPRGRHRHRHRGGAVRRRARTPDRCPACSSSTCTSTRVTGFYTRLVHASEGWTDHRLAHHPCYEEAYTVQGHMEYNFGTLDLGTYFFRPARVKHGHFTTMEGGATWLLRSDGELLNWYTQNEWVRWGGEAVNYGPDGTRMRWSQSTHDLGTRPDLAQRRRPARARRLGAVAARPGRRRPRVRRRTARAPTTRWSPWPRPSTRRTCRAATAGTTTATRTGTTTCTSPARTATCTTARSTPRSCPAPTGAATRSCSSTGTSAPTRTPTTGARAGSGRRATPTPRRSCRRLPVRSRSRGRWDGDGM